MFSLLMIGRQNGGKAGDLPPAKLRPDETNNANSGRYVLHIFTGHRPPLSYCPQLQGRHSTELFFNFIAGRYKWVQLAWEHLANPFINENTNVRNVGGWLFIEFI